MKKTHLKRFGIASGLLAAFAMWTLLIRFVDVQAIGPRGSSVGFATVNRWVHNFFGVHMGLYNITDWLGLVPVAFGFGFAVLGLIQWIRRKHILKVDPDILILGGFYGVVLGVYLFFEAVIVNYRPVLIGGYLEASYPSSTTLLVLCVMPTAILQLHGRIQNAVLRKSICFAISAFTAFVILGRLISGVHWFTDIVGATLLGAGLVMLYRAFCRLISNK